MNVSSGARILFPLLFAIPFLFISAVSIIRGKEKMVEKSIFAGMSLLLAWSLTFLGLILTMFIPVPDVTEVYEQDKAYYVEQTANVPEGYSFQLYEKYGLFKKRVAETEWRWNSVSLDGATINLVPVEGYSTNYVYNIERKVLGRGTVFSR